DPFTAEEALRNVPPSFIELSGTESDSDVFRIIKDHIIVPVHVAVGRTHFAAPGCHGLGGMTLQHPIADIDRVNVLFHDDIAGKHAVVHPVSDATLFRGGVGPLRPLQLRPEVMRFATTDLAQSPRVDALHHLDKGRSVANLESYVQAEATLC